MRAALIAAMAAAFALATGPALAQGTDACAAFKWPLARERAALTATNNPTLVSGAAYPGLGQGVAVTLQPQAKVAYTVAPRHKAKADPAYGAELTLMAAAAGTLQVTLSDDAWVDLVQDGKILRSTDFSGKTGCAGVRKSVRFVVAPGPLVVAISDAPASTIKVDVDGAE